MKRRTKHPNKKIGRPAAYEKDQTLVPRIVELAKAGLGVGKIAKELGLNKRALQDWRKIEPRLAKALPIQSQLARHGGPIDPEADFERALAFARDYDAKYGAWPDLITILKGVGLSWSQHKIRKRVSAKYRELMESFDYETHAFREYGMKPYEIKADRAEEAAIKKRCSRGPQITSVSALNCRCSLSVGETD